MMTDEFSGKGGHDLRGLRTVREQSCLQHRDSTCCSRRPARLHAGATFSMLLTQRGADLHDIGLSEKTDKPHLSQFTLYYPRFLDSLRSQSFDMLEIGVAEAGSLRMWERYFPNATVYGADPEPYPGEARIFRVDQSDPSTVEDVARARRWQLVIDDASHKPAHQLRTFTTMFTMLPPNAIYIIEDIETSYWRRTRDVGIYEWNMENDHVHLVRLFQRAVDQILNAHFLCPHELQPVFSTEVDAAIATVSFLRNAVIVTRTDPRHKRNRRAHYEHRYKLRCGEGVMADETARQQAQSHPVDSMRAEGSDPVRTLTMLRACLARASPHSGSHHRGRQHSARSGDMASSEAGSTFPDPASPARRQPQGARNLATDARSPPLEALRVSTDTNCGITLDARELVTSCSHDSMGSWIVGKGGFLGIHNLSDCVAACRCCDQCRHVSFSAADGDCSWYRNCTPSRMWGWTTVEVTRAR